MKKLFQWVSSHIFLTVLLILLIFILPIVAIVYVNKVLSPSFFIDIGISADSLITYVAGFEAFLGTVVLGIATLIMNNNADKLNKKTLARDKKRDQNERQPFLALDSWIIRPIFGEIALKEQNQFFKPKGSDLEFIDDSIYGILLTLKNVSRTFTSVDIIKMHSYSLDNPAVQVDFDRINTTPVQTFFHASPNQEIKLGFLFQKETLFGNRYHICTMQLELYNTITENFIETISFSITHTDETPIWLELGSYSIVENTEG